MHLMVSWVPMRGTVVSSYCAIHEAAPVGITYKANRLQQAMP
jgi:hypothetical protein